jgi:hypothetical protein
MQSMTEQDTLVVGGVDAHADIDHAAALDQRGGLLARGPDRNHHQPHHRHTEVPDRTVRPANDDRATTRRSDPRLPPRLAVLRRAAERRPRRRALRADQHDLRRGTPQVPPATTSRPLDTPPTTVPSNRGVILKTTTQSPPDSTAAPTHPSCAAPMSPTRPSLAGRPPPPPRISEKVGPNSPREKRR